MFDDTYMPLSLDLETTYEDVCIVGLHFIEQCDTNQLCVRSLYQNNQLQLILLGRDTCNPTFVIHNSDKSLCTLTHTQSRTITISTCVPN